MFVHIALVAAVPVDLGDIPSVLGERTRMRWRGYGTPIHLQLFLPRIWTPQKKWPLVVFLHGAAGNGWTAMNSQSLPRLLSRDQSTAANPAKTWTLEFGGTRYANETFADDFNFVVVMPQSDSSATSSGWNRGRLLEVKSLVNAVVDHYSIDTARVVLTGQSNGAVGAWLFAIHHPELWSAVVPICGASPIHPPIVAEHLRGVPIWVFHAATDAHVPVARSDELVAAIKAKRNKTRDKAPIRYTRYLAAPNPVDPAFADFTGHASGVPTAK
ncbi:hypothetical protein CTAYLR_010659 [Chrysophaeum taylorii]|uniref:Feruloyl esterase n=1 Tax=Chrysophaeum taylorii TaxID=2483200 RepID=A0AAD7XHZ5_9STRA|nr:hypothetical protein CTAYLR_010659 [Chrysophaeum taylorii]